MAFVVKGFWGSTSSGEAKIGGREQKVNVKEKAVASTSVKHVVLDYINVTEITVTMSFLLTIQKCLTEVSIQGFPYPIPLHSHTDRLSMIQRYNN